MTYGRFQPLSQEVLQKCGLLEYWNPGPLEKLFLAYEADEKSKPLDEIYALNYFKRIKDGTLNPDKYGSLIVLDSFYCFNAVKSLEIAAGRAETLGEIELRDFLSTLHDSYYEYVKTFPTLWHLNTSTSSNELLQSVVIPTEAMEAYVNIERTVAADENYHPIYTLVAMYPCYRLWPWLYIRIYNDLSGNLDGNVYGEWIKGNMSSSSAQAVDAFVSSWIESGKKWDNSLAKNVLVASLTSERLLFTEASPAKVPI